MQSPARPAVERRHPPAALLKVINPLVRRLAARGRAGAQVLVLHFTGRRTGRHFDVPAGYHVIDAVPTVFTNSPWRHNFTGGRDVEVTFRGKRRPAHATLVRDAETVTDAYANLISRLGWRPAQRRLGIRVNVRRHPTQEEIRTAVESSGLSMIRLSGLVDETRPPGGGSSAGWHD